VAGAGGDLLERIGDDRCAGDGEEAAAVDRRDRAVGAEVMAAAARPDRTRCFITSSVTRSRNNHATTKCR
jgi:hypothetical protein